ncbi:MAG TPA: HPP family protein, partial [candidate division WOR-3 bacterium]|nr:HPP family protein [candidate division WOR-3 bacterium]
LKIHYVIFGALSVGISLFLMAITDTEHPPAAGMALGLVINTWDYNTLLFIVGAVVVMYSVKRILRPLMVDLI